MRRVPSPQRDSHPRGVDRSHSWAAVSVLDADVTMRFWTARLLPFEFLLPPTRFSTRLVSASLLVAFVHLVRGPRIFISDHLGGPSCQSTPFTRRVRANRPPPLRMRSLWTGSLLAPRDFWRRPLSFGTCPPVMTCKANTGQTRQFQHPPLPRRKGPRG